MARGKVGRPHKVGRPKTVKGKQGRPKNVGRPSKRSVYAHKWYVKNKKNPKRKRRGYHYKKKSVRKRKYRTVPKKASIVSYR